MSEPTLSVLLPNYNNEPYLKECLDSLLSQTFQDFIIFFVDDCSTDNSIAVAESYQSEKLIIIKKDKNSGIVDTLNEGLRRVKSKYFIRMDGDDISVLSRFQKLVDFMDNNPTIDICTSDMLNFGTETGRVNFERDILQNKANLIFSHTIGHPSSIFKTEIFRKNNIEYKNDYWRLEDYQLFYRLKDIANCTAISEPLYLYRRGIYNLNDTIRKKKVEEYRRFYAMIFNDLGLKFMDSDLSSHIELAGTAISTNKLTVYKNHVKKIIAANQKSLIFPKKELEITLNRALIKMCFLQIDLKKLSLGDLLPFIFKDKNLLRYYLIKKIRT